MQRLTRFLLHWLLLTALSIALFWFMWYIMEKPVYDEYSWRIVLFDIAYCAGLTLCVMGVCHGAVRLLQPYMNRLWVFSLTSVGCLVINLLIAHFIEISVVSLMDATASVQDVTEGVYVCCIVATLLSMILLSHTYYRFYVRELKERKRREEALMKQQLTIADLQRALENAKKQEEIQDKQQEPTIDVATLLNHLGMERKNYRNRFLIPSYNGVSVLEVNRISHITLEEERITAYLQDGKSVVMEENSLDVVESRLDPCEFFRANRQYIVSIHSIDRLSNYFNQTKILYQKNYPSTEIKISKDKYARLKEWLG